MTETRKLAAVMFTDIVGYTALMSKDEQMALAILQKNREMQKSLAEKHNGEFLKEMGDGTLLCFQSALDAVRCAMEIQKTVRDDPNFNLRIGIHLGDIVFKEGDVFGDGVNVASRIENLAEAGGICISGTIYEIVKNKPNIDSVFLGEKRLKNVEDPVIIYALTGEGLPPPSATSFKADHNKLSGKRRPIRILLPVFIVLLLITSLYLIQKLGTISPNQYDSNKNSIAVMYFENRSGEEDLERILTEMLTSNLSRCRDISVISTQHLFDILKEIGKQDAVNINRNTATEIARKANVKTMLLGSINKIGTRFHINAQLCDVKSGSVIGPSQAQGARVEDIYEIVNHLTEDVIQLMGITPDENNQPLKINDVTTNSFYAYKHYQKGLEHLRRWEYRDGIKEFQEAVQIDTTFAMAYCHMAVSLGASTVANPLLDASRVRQLIKLASKYSTKATEREQDFIKTVVPMLHRDFNLFIVMAKEVEAKYPGDKVILYYLGIGYYIVGHYEQMIESLRKVLEIDPLYTHVYNLLAYGYIRLNEHEEAISAIKKYIAFQPDVINTYDSGFEIYFMAGRYDEAYRVCDDALRINPEGIEFIRYKSYIHLFRCESEMAYTLIHDLIIRYPSQERALRNDLGCFNMYNGMYRDAGAEFQKVIDITQKTRNTNQEISAHLNLGKFYTVIGNFTEAFQEFTNVKNTSIDVYGDAYNTWPIRADYYRGIAYILQGNYDDAERAADSIETFIKDNRYDDVLMDFHYLLNAEIQIEKSQPEVAYEIITKVSGITKRRSPRFCRLMAEIYILQGKYDNAFQKYQELFNDWIKIRYYMFNDYFQERSMANYHIAKLFEIEGKTQQAILFFQKALDQWKNADEDMAEGNYAKQVLVGLKKDR